MIVPANIAQALMRGEATHLRRAAGRSEDRPPWRAGDLVAIRRAVEASAIGRVIVIEVVPQAIAEASIEDLRAEGWRGRDPRVPFARHWLWRHDPAYRPALELASEDELLDRLASRHGARATWRAVVFPDPSAPARLLAARSEYGYVRAPAMALPEEPEAVEEWVQERITQRARERDAERRDMHESTTRRRLRNDITDLQQRIMAARLRARSEGADPTALEALRLADAQMRRAARATAARPPGPASHTADR